MDKNDLLNSLSSEELSRKRAVAKVNLSGLEKEEKKDTTSEVPETKTPKHVRDEYVDKLLSERRTLEKAKVDLRRKFFSSLSQKEYQAKKLSAQEELGGKRLIKVEAKAEAVPARARVKAPISKNLPSFISTQESVRENDAPRAPVQRNLPREVLAPLVRSEGPERAARVVRTTAGDIEKVIKGDNVSIAKIFIEERERKRRMGEKIYIGEGRKKHNVVLILSILFILAVTSAISYFIVLSKETPTGIVKQIRIKSIIYADSSIVFDATPRGDFRRDLETSLAQTEILNDKIKTIIFTDKDRDKTKQIKASEFLGLLGVEVPSGLSRILEPEFMFGVHSQDTNYGFIILKNKSFENAFAGMLSWEESILSDLGSILTETIAGRAEGASWEDLEIKNTQLRGLRDNTDNTILLYSFLNKETILITASNDTFIEVLKRFQRPTEIVI